MLSTEGKDSEKLMFGDDPDEEKPHNQPIEPLSWFQTWKLALTRPSVATFERIAHDPNATSRRAYNWLFIAYLVGYLLPLSILLYRIRTYTVLSGLLCFSAPAIVFLTIITVHIIQWIAKRLGGTGTYNELIYAFAASIAPIGLIGTAVYFIPKVQDSAVYPLLSYSISLYNFLLFVLAVRAVHQFGWGKAIVSLLTPIIPSVIAVAVASIAFVIVASGFKSAKMMTDQDFRTLTDALSQRWKNDDVLSNTNVRFDIIPNTNYTDYEWFDYWMVIEMQYTGNCSTSLAYPCDKLADEFAQIVFVNYRIVNDIAGIKVVIENQPFENSVEPSDIQFQKSLTIEEWREHLSLGK